MADKMNRFMVMKGRYTTGRAQVNAAHHLAPTHRFGNPTMLQPGFVRNDWVGVPKFKCHTLATAATTLVDDRDLSTSTFRLFLDGIYFAPPGSLMQISTSWCKVWTDCALPAVHCVSVHRAKNIEVFAQLRAYLQSHKVLELRYVEVLLLIMSLAGAVFSVFIVVVAFEVSHAPKHVC